MIGEPTDPGERVTRELERVVIRLNALGPGRLVRAGADGTSPAERVRVVLTHLADAAADAEGLPRHPVPELAPHALGDQLVVLTRDLVHDLQGVAAEPALADLADRLTALRRAL